ncbi:MAG: amino acid ABC transporter permease [Acidaminococcaceae bacterium]
MISPLLDYSIISFLLEGLAVTLKISFFSIIFSVIFGTLIGLTLYLKIPVLKQLSILYVDIVRNVPCLLLVLTARFMTPLPPTYSGVLAMSVFTAAIMSEIIRGGLNSLPKGQVEAAQSQGLSTWQIVRHIVLPQAYRNVIPPMVSQFTTVIKDSAFVWAVGTEELTGRGMILIGKYSTTAQVFTIFGAVAILYFLLNYSLSVLARWQHNKMSIRSY